MKFNMCLQPLRLAQMFPALNAADAKDKLIVRVYESDGQENTDVTLTLPSNVKSAKEVNLLEKDDEDLNKEITVDGNQIHFSMGKYEITTIALEVEPYGGEDVELKSAPVDLFDYYNVDAVSFNEDRKDGDYDGEGNTIPRLCGEAHGDRRGDRRLPEGECGARAAAAGRHHRPAGRQHGP